MQKTCLIIGMDLEIFWKGNPDLYYIYIDAYKQKQEQKAEENDYMCWLQARYNMDAFAQVIANSFSKSKKQIYPKEPYSVTNKRKNLSLEEKAYAWINAVNKRF